MKIAKINIGNYIENIKIGGANECWPSVKNLSKNGYLMVSCPDRTYYSHTITYRLKYGEFKKGLPVLHFCEDKTCNNPLHLFLGTKENLRIKLNLDFRKQLIRDKNGCLLFTGRLEQDGYGRIKSNKIRYMIHQYAWELAYGENSLPDGISVFHKCENRHCAEVEHLFLGTQENLDKRALEQFYSNIFKMPNDGCWIYKGGQKENWYGSLWYQNKKVSAHRLSFELASGKPIPDGMFVCHECDVPSCVRPEHLWLGTQEENMQDCAAKGRHNSTAVLKKEEALEIRQALKKGIKQRILANKFNVSQTTISDIANNKTMEYLEKNL